MSRDDLVLVQTIKGRRIKPLKAPSGNTYLMPGRPGMKIKAQTVEDYDWLLSIRMRGG